MPLSEQMLQKIDVLICEDSHLTRLFLIEGLAQSGIPVRGVEHGRDLDRAMARKRPDIVILDVNLPGEDGFSIAERLRREHPRIGIIMVTSRDRLEDRVRGLDAGADLYFVKPLELAELVSALGSLYRRLSDMAPRPERPFWRVDPVQACLISPKGCPIPLSENELRFLTLLLRQPGETLDREQLLEAMGQASDVYAMRRMETMISRLRSKAQQHAPEEPLPVKARHGKGYAFLAETKGARSG